MAETKTIADMRTPVLLTVVGVFNDAGFLRCARVAAQLASEFVTVDAAPSALTETDWEDWAAQKKRELGGAAYAHDAAQNPMVLYNGCNYIGGTQAFFAWARRVYDAEIDAEWLQDALIGTTPARAYDAAFEKHPDADARHSFVELELQYDGAGEGKEQEAPQSGKVCIELYEELCPNACANFKALCAGKGGVGYAGTPFHRVVPGGYVLGGDVVSGHGDAGKAALGGEAEDTFADECFTLSHGQTGIVSMSNQGAHTNASQFFVTLKPLPFLDTKFQAIGRVVTGMRHFRGIEKMPMANQRPQGTCVIAAAQVLAEPNGALVGEGKEAKSE